MTDAASTAGKPVTGSTPGAVTSAAPRSVSYDFSGRRAVVTGGARGLGRGVAERLRDAGAVVEAWDVDPVAVDGIVPVAVDVTSSHQV
ncbi:hypothetical protein CH338_26240, partial [Rhodoplanes elegans]